MSVFVVFHILWSATIIASSNISEWWSDSVEHKTQTSTLFHPLSP